MRFFALTAATVLILQGIALSPGDPPAPSSQDDPAIRFMLANTMWTRVHEMGHAMIAELDVPLLGK